MSNPFTISFGNIPSQQIARNWPMEEIVEDYTSGSPSSHVYMITGVRGSGKTVLMTQIANELKEKPDWYVIDLNPGRDMLQSLAGKLYTIREAQKIFEEAQLNLTMFGFGLTLKHSPQITDIEAAVGEMLRQLQKHGKRLLVTVDEAVNNEHVRIFAASFQSLLREGHSICLLMTGLYENINSLQNEKNLTFLYRAPKYSLRPLSLPAIRSAYSSVFEIEDEDAVEMTKLTRGYPFAFQVLGYLCWKNGGKWDPSVLIPQYDQHLEEYSYEKIWMELSQTERKFLMEMAKQPEVSHQSLREGLSISPQMLYKYKKRLLRKGLLAEKSSGGLIFALPRFREFVRMQMLFEE